MSGKGVDLCRLEKIFRGRRTKKSKHLKCELMGRYPAGGALGSKKYIGGYSRVSDTLRKVRAIWNMMKISYRWSRYSVKDEGWLTIVVHQTTQLRPAQVRMNAQAQLGRADRDRIQIAPRRASKGTSVEDSIDEIRSASHGKLVDSGAGSRSKG